MTINYSDSEIFTELQVNDVKITIGLPLNDITVNYKMNIYIFKNVKQKRSTKCRKNISNSPLFYRSPTCIHIITNIHIIIQYYILLSHIITLLC